MSLRQYRLNGESAIVPSALPTVPVPFVAREDVARVLNQRLLTGPYPVFLTGPDGIGKTGLAIYTAHRLYAAGYFTDGVIWLDGRVCRSYGGLLDEFCLQLGLRPVAGTTDAQRAHQIVTQVSANDYLVVLDELEALAEGRVAALHLLRQLSSPVLVTARLHPPGREVPLRLSPLLVNEAMQLFEALGVPPPFDRRSPHYAAFEGSPLVIRLLAPLLSLDFSANELIAATEHVPRGTNRGSLWRDRAIQTTHRSSFLGLQEMIADQQQVVLVASLVSGLLDADLMAAMLQLRVEQVQADLQRLALRGFLTPISGGSETQPLTYWRMHTTLREAFDGLPAAAGRYHQRAATALALRGPNAFLPAVEHLRKTGRHQVAARWLVQQIEPLIALGRIGALSEELASFLPTHIEPAIYLELSEARGDLACRTQNFDEAASYYEQAIGPLRQRPASHETRAIGARLARKLGETYEARGNFASARLWLDRAEQALPAQAQTERVHIRLSRSRMAISSNLLDEALSMAQEALTLAQTLSGHESIALLRDAHRQIGVVSQAQGNLLGANAAFLQALALAEQDGAPRPLAEILVRLAETEQQQGHWMNALEALERSIQLWREVGVERPLAVAMLQAGVLLMGQGSFMLALEQLREAERLARTLGDEHLALMASIRQSEALVRAGDLEGAVELLRPQRDAATHGGWPDLLAEHALVRSELSRRQTEMETAELWAVEATRWAQRADNRLIRTRAEALRAVLAHLPTEIERTITELDHQAQWLDAVRIRLDYVAHLMASQPVRAAPVLEQARAMLPMLGAVVEIEVASELNRRLGKNGAGKLNEAE